MKGTIIENTSNLYKIACENGEIYEANARGKLKQEDIKPVVGDKVEFTKLEEEGKAVIEKIEKREVYIKRPKMANINQIIFVVSCKNPKPDLLMLDKSLVFAEYIGTKVIIVLNKTDLDKKDEFKNIKKIYKKIGYEIIETTANQGIGIDELIKKLKNNISAFSGNSGVGKSTLINAIFKNEITQEGEISKKNKRGKNTTTATKLYQIEENTYIADTPGFSTFEIDEIESKDLAKYFKEFQEYIDKCEFVDCKHLKEENCGIKKAIEQGKITEDRYDRFCKIYQELKQKEEKKNGRGINIYFIGKKG